MQECDLLITSVITDRIGRHEVLLLINWNYEKFFEKGTRNRLYVFIKKNS